MAKVFIGVGHGGKDPGAVGKVREAAANLVIALALREELTRHGVLVGISRTQDENDPLTEEIKEANAFKPDVAIDVHNNAGEGKGFEVLVQTNKYATDSKKLGNLLEKEVKAIGQESRGVKTKKNTAGTADYFGFLREVKCPAVIVEGFFVDSSDALDFDTIGEQRKLGESYAKAILSYLGIRYMSGVTYADIVQKRFGFDDETIEFLKGHPYADALFEKLATK
jgi:N-acetylmuramoyl-L-alanine amidase